MPLARLTGRADRASSQDNFSTAYGAASHHHVPTIGFANSLSHTIIREQQEDDTKSDDGVSISDEELALLGAPWAKEGILQRKHYWESLGKRAKEKGWLQAFIVVSAGELRMFRFDGAGSTRGTGGGMGGGDWTVSTVAFDRTRLEVDSELARSPRPTASEKCHSLTLSAPPCRLQDTARTVHTASCSLCPITGPTSSRPAHKISSPSGSRLATTGQPA